MGLAKKDITAGDVVQYRVSYRNVMRDGDWITSAIVTVNNPAISITGVAVIEPHRITFFVGGASVNGDFTVSLVVTENNSEIHNDTMDFHVVAP